MGILTMYDFHSGKFNERSRLAQLGMPLDFS